jgi:hypothetical protein
MIRSIDALESTPGRIARLCHEETMAEDDCDDEVVVDFDQYDGMALGEDDDDVVENEISPVKKRLMIDPHTDGSHNSGSSRKEKSMLDRRQKWSYFNKRRDISLEAFRQ